MDTQPNSHGTTADAPGGAYAWYAVFVLIVAYTFSFIDRQILTLLVGPIRESLQISDFQISLLHGLAFAIFYTTLGIPIGRLVDSRRRTTIIAIGIAFWSLMTAFCGLARNFGQLFLARIGVGIGEASLSPAAYSMLSDYFPPSQLPRALSLYTGAAHIGAGIATIAGGALIALAPPMNIPGIGHLEAWQVVFILVGLPGLIVALWALTLREPKRMGLKAGGHPSLGEVFRYMNERRNAYGILIIGYSISGLMWNGSIAWLPTYFIREFGWTTSEVGLRYGLAVMIGGTLGVVLGGAIASGLRQRGVTDANIWIGLIALAVAAPAGIAGALADAPMVAYGCVAVFLFGCAIPWGALPPRCRKLRRTKCAARSRRFICFALRCAASALAPWWWRVSPISFSAETTRLDIHSLRPLRSRRRSLPSCSGLPANLIGPPSRKMIFDARARLRFGSTRSRLCCVDRGSPSRPSETRPRSSAL